MKQATGSKNLFQQIPSMEWSPKSENEITTALKEQS